MTQRKTALGMHTLDAILSKTPDLEEKEKLIQLFKKYNLQGNTHAISIWNYFGNLISKEQKLADFFNSFDLINHYEIPRIEFHEKGTFSNDLKNIFTIKTNSNEPLIVGSKDIKSISNIAMLFNVEKLYDSQFKEFGKKHDEKKTKEILEKINRVKLFDLGNIILKERNFARDYWSKIYKEKFKDKLDASIDKLAKVLEKSKIDVNPERTLLKLMAPNANDLNKIYYDPKTPKDIFEIALKIRKKISSVDDKEWRIFNLYLSLNTYKSINIVKSVVDDLNYIKNKYKRKFTSDQETVLEKKEINLVEFAEIMFIDSELFKKRQEENEQTTLDFSLKKVEIKNPFLYIFKKTITDEGKLNSAFFEKHKKLVNKEILKKYLELWSFKTSELSNEETTYSNREIIYRNAKSIEGMSDFHKITKQFALWQRQTEYFEKTQKTLEGNLSELPLKIKTHKRVNNVTQEFFIEMTLIEFIDKIKTAYLLEKSELIKFKEEKLPKIEEIVSYGLIDEKSKSAIKRRIDILSKYNYIKSILTSKKDPTPFEISFELRDQFIKAYQKIESLNNDITPYKQGFEKEWRRKFETYDEKPIQKRFNEILTAKYFDWYGIQDVVKYGNWLDVCIKKGQESK